MKALRLATQPPDAQSAAEKYVALKSEAENISNQMARLRKVLELALLKMPDLSIRVGDELLSLIVCQKQQVDLASAKRKLGAKLSNYIEVIEKLDLKAAQKHMGEAKLAPFVTISEYTTLRLRPLKDDTSEED